MGNPTTKEKFSALLGEMRLDASLIEDYERVYAPMAMMLRSGLTKGTAHVIGVNGAQGAGKTTFCRLLKMVLEEDYGMKVAWWSIDDLYLSKAAREKLADNVHPLLATRGVPGTHDITLGMNLIKRLKEATEKTTIYIPVFDKATDNPLSEKEWIKHTGRPDVILFDGWCVGCSAEEESALEVPVNRLEAEEDANKVWRTFVNTQLKTRYKDLFGMIDTLVMLKVPKWEKVKEWRMLQEHKLKAKIEAEQDEKKKMQMRAMTDEEVERFVEHYERLTKHILREMPERADILFEISNGHRVLI